MLNGKRVLPYQILMAGLKGGNKVAGAYVVLNSEFKRGSEGWEHCEHIGISLNLEGSLKKHFETYGDESRVAHVRALTFVVPSEGAMEEIAQQWRVLATDQGGRVNFDPVLAALEEAVPFDDDDDDWDEDDDDFYEEMAMTANAMSTARESVPIAPPDPVAEAETITPPSGDDADENNTVVSPFDDSSNQSAVAVADDDKPLAFTCENVDKVLNEVRPYLISDGGNVSVDRVDESTKNVYLKLEGACGSCPSSTVTMKMGIERVLNENFDDLGEVLQVEDDDEEKPTELTWQTVENEVERIKPAIIAMGGVVRIKNVDPIGVVELEFRGANKVRQGLELALLDIDFVKHVKFVMSE
jgi:Fe-S cluster biogenesis protein NfuA